MGSFGIEFTDSFSKKHLNDEVETSTDSFFQKSLAYSSYYVMLFVAYIMITPDKMNMASNLFGSLFT